MKRIALLMFVLSCFLGNAQIFNPVNWEFNTKNLGENSYELIFEAELDDGWSIYSQFVEEGGPIPTTFEFEENEAYERIGGVTEDELNKETSDYIYELLAALSACVLLFLLPHLWL